MELLTTQKLIKQVAESWRAQYPRRVRQPDVEKEEIYARLLVLPETATAEDVEAIIGNISWTRFTCNECGEYKTRAVQLGEEPDYESHTATLCRECLEKALALVTSLTEEELR